MPKYVDRDIALQRMLAIQDGIPDLALYIQNLEAENEGMRERIAELEREVTTFKIGKSWLHVQAPQIGPNFQEEAPETYVSGYDPEDHDMVKRTKERHSRRHGGIFGR